jgi:hypothetical protein
MKDSGYCKATLCYQERHTEQAAGGPKRDPEEPKQFSFVFPGDNQGGKVPGGQQSGGVISRQ